jgi:subtilisin family serine protease
LKKKEFKMRILILLFCVVVLSSQLVVELEKGVDPQEFAHSHELVFEKHLFNSFYVFSSQSSQHARSIIEKTQKRDGNYGVKWAEEQIPIKRFKRERMVDDPLYSQQWHLNMIEEKESGGGGLGILIGIVDDGLQHTHPELSSRYSANHSWNFNDGNVRDPSPRDPQDGHGTAAAAVAVATKLNGRCGRGVAWAASVAGIRLIAQPVTGATEAEALSFHSTHIRIYSNSWGPADTGRGMDAPSRVVREALAYFAGVHNRIYVWASGNGRDNGDSCSYDGYAGNPYVNAIGAVDYDSNQSWYSEGCANLMAVAPSSGSSGRSITTADLLGPSGYDPGECTSSFGGTSSAAPLASGIIALLLERNPQLSWRDVKHVIALGATQINPEHESWHTNERGYHHSNAFGFGLLKVPPLLRVLSNYTLLNSPQKQVFSNVIRPSKENTNSFLIHMNNTNITFIENVILRIALTHPRRGDVVVRMVSPEGTQSVLAERRNDPNSNYPSEGWSFSSLRHWGERAADGLWEVQVDDGSDPQKTRVQWLVIGIFGF